MDIFNYEQLSVVQPQTRPQRIISLDALQISEHDTSHNNRFSVTHIDGNWGNWGIDERVNGKIASPVPLFAPWCLL